MSWKDLIFEHEESQKESPLPPAHPIDVVRTSSPLSSPLSSSIPSPVATYLVTPAVAGDDKLYEKLKANTDVGNLAGAISKVLALTKPLEAVIPDPALRLKAAIATAKSQGVSTGDISRDLSNLSGALASEKDKFSAAITARHTDLAAKEQKANDMEKQLHDLRVEISDSKTSLDRAATGFDSAFARRSSEIESLKGQFTEF